MNCKQIQDLLLTDYADGETSEEQGKAVESHLENCSRCREFEAAFRQTAIQPFRTAERAEPPDAVWSRIKKEIEQEQKEGGKVLWGLGATVRSWFVMRKPVPVLATLAALLLITVTLTQLQTKPAKRVDVNLEEQMDYVAYLLGETNGSSGGETEGFGTSIEEYFL